MVEIKIEIFSYPSALDDCTNIEIVHHAEFKAYFMTTYM